MAEEKVGKFSIGTLEIATDFVWIERESRTIFNLITDHANHHIKANDSGPTIKTEDQNKLIEKFSGQLHPGNFWIIAGSLPPGVPTKTDGRYDCYTKPLHWRNWLNRQVDMIQMEAILN